MYFLRVGGVLLAAATLAVATPALATGRGIQADDPEGDESYITQCFSTCDASFVLPYTYGSAQVFMEGVLVLGVLPDGFDVTDPSTYGQANYFAPSLGAAMSRVEFRNAGVGTNINWYAGDTIKFQVFIDVESQPFPEVFFGGAPRPNTITAYRYVDPLCAAPCDIVTDSTDPFEEGPGVLLDSSHRYLSGAVPEPSTWMMMLAGFGGLGAALRANRRRKAYVAAA